MEESLEEIVLFAFKKTLQPTSNKDSKMRHSFVTICSLLGLFSSHLAYTSDEIDVTQALRIHQLMPPEKLTFHFAIEPAVPNDFIAQSPNGDIDYSDWVYWGSPEALKAFFQDTNSLSKPIMRVRIAPNTLLSEVVNLEEEKLRRGLTEAGLKPSSIKSGKWGNHYPYFSLAIPFQNKKIHGAFVGLDDGSDIVLQIEFLCPERKSNSGDDLALWKRFLTQTHELSEPLFFKALGQELHKGYTIVNLYGHKIKVIAEKRTADQKVQFVVIPDSLTPEFNFKSVFQCLMGANWHHGEPLLKVNGLFKINEYINHEMTASVLIKEVLEFTHIPPQKNIFIHQL